VKVANPNTNQAAIRLAAALALANGAEVDQACRTSHALGIVAAVEIFVRDRRVRHGGGRDQVVEANLVSFPANRMGERVDRQFHRETDARSRDGAIWHERRFVGRDDASLRPIGSNGVRTGQVANRHHCFMT
jgi:hypothetical protein